MKPSASGERRRRYQVKSACVPCRASHVACDNQRPCHRCTRNHTEAECIDITRSYSSRKKLHKSPDNTDSVDQAVFSFTPQPQQFQIPYFPTPLQNQAAQQPFSTIIWDTNSLSPNSSCSSPSPTSTPPLLDATTPPENVFIITEPSTLPTMLNTMPSNINTTITTATPLSDDAYYHGDAQSTFTSLLMDAANTLFAPPQYMPGQALMRGDDNGNDEPPKIGAIVEDLVSTLSSSGNYAMVSTGSMIPHTVTITPQCESGEGGMDAMKAEIARLKAQVEVLETKNKKATQSKSATSFLPFNNVGFHRGAVALASFVMPTGETIECNRSFRKLFQISKDVLAQTFWVQRITPMRYLTGQKALFEKYLRSPTKSIKGINTLAKLGGDEVTVELLCVLARPVGGSPILTVIIIP